MAGRHRLSQRRWRGPPRRLKTDALFAKASHTSAEATFHDDGFHRLTDRIKFPIVWPGFVPGDLQAPMKDKLFGVLAAVAGLLVVSVLDLSRRVASPHSQRQELTWRSA